MAWETRSDKFLEYGWFFISTHYTLLRAFSEVQWSQREERHIPLAMLHLPIGKIAFLLTHVDFGVHFLDTGSWSPDEVSGAQANDKVQSLVGPK